MITREEAVAIFERMLEEIGLEMGFECACSGIIEEDFGWVFGYQGKAYLETGSIENDYIIGNAPFIIDRHDGSIHVTGTAYPIEHYIKEYRQSRKK